MILTESQKDKVKWEVYQHSSLCCRDWQHIVAVAAAWLYKGKSEVKKLEAQQAVLFYLATTGEFAVLTKEDAKRVQVAVRELVRRDPTLESLVGDLAKAKIR